MAMRPVSALNIQEQHSRSQFRITKLDRSIRQDDARSEGLDMLRVTSDVKHSQLNVSSLFTNFKLLFATKIMTLDGCNEAENRSP